MAACPVLLVLFVILPLQFTSNEACFINSEDKCLHFADIKGFSFHAFIQQFILQSQCTKLTTALKCVLDDAEGQECELSKTFMFEGQNDVLKAICGNMKADYLYSEPCFLDMKTAIEDCIKPILQLRSREICNTIETARTCVRTTVRESTRSLCDDISTRTMSKLFDLHVQPMATAFSCSLTRLPDITKPQLSMTTEASTATLSTMMTTMMTTTMDDMTTKHHNRSYSLAQETPFTWLITMTVLTLMTSILM